MPTLKGVLNPNFLLDLLFPPGCLECGVQTTRSNTICPSCWQRIKFIEKPVCDRLGVPFAFEPGEGILSAEALAKPPNYARARYVAHYEGVARSLVQKIKFRDQTHLAQFMADLMIKMGADVIASSDLILPVPLHYRRLIFRRFNQAALLGEYISRRTETPIDTRLLMRKKPTRSQIGLSRAARRKNVAKAFSIKKNHHQHLAGRKILLIDDVVTTGSTIEACTDELLKAGACEVSILGFARVVDGVRGL